MPFETTAPFQHLAALPLTALHASSTPAPSLPTLSNVDPQDVKTWSERLGHWLVTSGVRIVVIVVVAVVVRWLLVRAVNRLVRRTVNANLSDRIVENRATRVLASATGALSERRRQRTETLGSVIRSLVTFVVFGVALLMVLGEFHVNLAPLLASAGVAGVALGFGAQSLVKDFLSGVFMLLEDQYGVGDLVDTGEAVGTVEQVTLRITKLRDPSGVAWYVRNGEITRIANKSQGWSTAIVDLPVAYTESVDRVMDLIRDMLDALYDDPEWSDVMLEKPTVAGVEQITGTTITIRVVAKTGPNQQWGLQRAIRERAKDAFDRAGVRAPVTFPPVPGGPSSSGTTPGAI
ncbi:MAG TPA: mechanosensitive ion channel family protein [Actinomycetales bacterium]|nr:mechanosensitive ion channel family protein [Actinomycetales bacterium]